MSDFRIGHEMLGFVWATAEPIPDGCGTAACMVGHAPFLGLPQPEENESWFTYAERVFGCGGDTYLFEFLFGSNWARVPGHNTARACRILWALENGVPKSYRSTEYPILEGVTEPDWFEDLRSRVLVDTPA